MKQVPQRMCIVCRASKDKKDFIRIVRDSSGNYELDFTGKKPGRGAYICNCEECIKKCIKTKALNRAFKENVSDEVYNAILEQYTTKQN